MAFFVGSALVTMKKHFNAFMNIDANNLAQMSFIVNP